MKRLFTLALIAIGLFTNAQNKAVGDTLEGAFINFEEATEYILVPEMANNLWQISSPNKNYFNASFSPTNAIVTDKLYNYSINNHSYFDLYITAANMPFFNMQMQLEFKHKFDTDTLLDGGYITVSYDNGLNWFNIINNDPYDMFPINNDYSLNLYSIEDTLFNGEKGFSGHSDGWQTTRISWVVFLLRGLNTFETDNVILRFNFISDAIDNDKEGWMIDDIRMFGVDLGSSINEKQTSTFAISPNPANDFVTVKLSKNQFKNRATVEIYNLSGQLVKQEKLRTSESRISVECLEKGIYILKIGAKKQRLLIE